MFDEAYIKMCEKAEKIQVALGREFDYDHQGYCTMHKCMLVAGEEGGTECPSMIDRSREPACVPAGTWIGLPTQAQLQELTCGFNGFIDWHAWLVNVYGWEYFADTNRSKQFHSWESLWLAFTMKENHNKTWDGVGW